MKHLLRIRHSLLRKHALLLLLMLTLVLGTGFCILYFFVDAMLAKSVDQKADLICRESVNRFDQSFFRCESIANMLAAVLAEYPQEDWMNVLDFSIKAISTSDEENLMAVCAATIPDASAGKADGDILIILHKGNTFQLLTGAKYTDQSWFLDVIRDGHGKWNEPFYGRLIHELIAVYSRPIFKTLPDGSKNIIGVVTADIGIQWMDQEISKIPLEYQGRAFLISDKMQLLALPDKEYIGKTFKKQINEYDELQDKIEQLAMNKQAGSFILHNKMTGEHTRFFFQPMRSTGWVFGIAFPEDEICLPMRFFRSGIIIMIAAIFIVIVFSILLMSYRISRSLRAIRKFAREIGKGNFSASVPQIRGKDERIILIATIDRMRLSLIKYIENLKQATMTNERIESELLVAQQIQNGLLPNTRPPFPDSDFFEASARLLSAKEIGGDLYDCAMIAPDKLFFVMGDVSGKGIPAALFMVFAQVMQRVLRYNWDLSPKKIVRRMNDILCINNKGRLFVTFICGFIDAKTGKITYCNAGHNPFFILKKNGSLDTPCEVNGIPLGLRKELVYTESECQIEPGDAIVLYTDGITEAENPDGEFYGTARFKILLRNCAGKNLSADEIEREIMQAVRRFSATCEQSDDITCMTVQYKKSGS